MTKMDRQSAAREKTTVPVAREKQRRILFYKPGRGIGILAFWLCLLSLVAAQAQRHPPEVRLVYPLGGSAGATTRVTISGISFRNATRILFDQSGITAKILAPEKAALPAPTLDDDGVPTITAEFTVDLTAPRDIYSFRVVSESGVSSPGKWMVGRALPQIEEVEPNNGRAQAQAVSLPVAVNGHISDASDADTFAFDLEVGKTFVAEVVAAQVGSPLDSLLTLQDSSGMEVASNDDYGGPDSLLVYTPRKSGRYFLTLTSSVGAGGPTHAYRLSIGYLPLLTGTLPGTLPRGKIVTVTPLGVNLPPTLQVTIPADSRENLANIYSAEGVSSNGQTVGVSDLPLVLEQEPNDDREHATPIPAPGIANGRFYRPGAERNGKPENKLAGIIGSDVDFYKFHAEAGKRYLFDVQGQDRSGKRTDPVLTLLDPEGKPLDENDDSVGRNAHLDRTFDKTGEYYLEVKNRAGDNAPDLVYQLMIQAPPPPGFSLSTDTRDRALGRGGSAAFEVQIERDRWDGPVTLTAADLPSGVVANTDVVPAGVNRGLVVLSADPNAPETAFPLHIVGTAEVNGHKVQQILTRANDRIWNGGALTLQPAPAGALYAAVTPPWEIAVKAEAPALTLQQGQSLKIKARIERRMPYAKPITLTVLGLPDGVTATNVTAPPDRTEAEIELKAMPNARTGAFPIVLDGVVTHNPQVLLDRVSAPIVLTITPVKVGMAAPAHQTGRKTVRF